MDAYYSDCNKVVFSCHLIGGENEWLHICFITFKKKFKIEVIVKMLFKIVIRKDPIDPIEPIL